MYRKYHPQDFAADLHTKNTCVLKSISAVPIQGRELYHQDLRRVSSFRLRAPKAANHPGIERRRATSNLPKTNRMIRSKVRWVRTYMHVGGLRKCRW